MSVKSFTIYEEYYDLITLLEEDEQKGLIFAIMNYMFRDIEPSLNDRQMKIFNNLKRPLNKSKIKSKATSKQNQNEIKKKSKSNQNENTSDVNVDVNVNNNIYNYIQSNLNINVLNSTNYELIEELRKEYDDKVLCYAIDKTIANGARSLNYFYAIVRNWKKDKLFKIEDIKREERIRDDANLGNDEEMQFLESSDWLNGE